MKLAKRILLSSFLLVVMLLCFSPSVKRVSAATLTQITVHYYRYDGNYSHFGWFWTESTNGQAKMMSTQSEFGRSCTFKVPSGCDDEEFGLLFCYTSGSAGKWGGEQTSDFYFDKSDLTVDANGNAHVYYIQAEDFPCFDKESAKEAMKDKFIYLSFDSAKTIYYIPSRGSVTNLKVFADNEEVAVTGVSGSKITLGANLDFDKSYEVRCKVNGQDVIQNVTFTSLFNNSAFNAQYEYKGNDLGANYTPEATTFKLWAPISKSVKLNLYHYGHTTADAIEGYPGEDTPYQTYELEKGAKGVWEVTVDGDLDGVYYTYTVQNGDTADYANELVDPYTKTTGLNGLRGMVVNMASDNLKLNPENWTQSLRATSGANVDSIIYEFHVRDLTAHNSWGGTPSYSGTFLGLAERGTTYTKDGTTVSTGLDHIIEMGVTDVHILPVMDSMYVDERLLNDEEYKSLSEDGIYNWGYMTEYFFTLDGAYSTNPYDGYARMKEFKQMVMTFHENDINVIMDVVFNHTGVASVSNFHKIIPYYFHRSKLGAMTNGSACGNEMASEHAMVRKLITDSCSYFATEYKVDGFRFDLMGLEDTTTMNAVHEKVSEINPSTIIYGEPWAGGESTNTYTPSTKVNMNKIPNVGAFNDSFRDGIRGEAGQGSWNGWMFGYNDNGQYDKTVFGIVGGAGYCNSANTGFTFTSPNQSINYVSCHDNYTLYDQISIKAGNILKSKPERMDALTQSLAIILTAQGVPFIEAGSEIGRTKGKYPANYSIVNDRGQRVHNSYNLGDSYNAIQWNWKIENLEYCKTIQEMIEIRKNHEAFRQTSYSDIQSVMSETINKGMYFNNGNLIAYQIKDSGDTWKEIVVLHANSTGTSSYTLPKASNPQGWEIVYSTNGVNAVGTYKKSNSAIVVGKNETVILVGNVYNKDDIGGGGDVTDKPEDNFGINNPLYSQFKTYLEYGLANLEFYCQPAQEDIKSAALEFINASYNTMEELNAAYKAYKAKVDVVKSLEQAAREIYSDAPFYFQDLLVILYYNANK